MVKKKIKKGKRKNIGQRNAIMKKVKDPMTSSTTIVPTPATLTYPAHVTAFDPQSNNSGGAFLGIEKKTEKTVLLSGFIFLCNSTTKLQCYQYRVFGLPFGKKEVVEAIKPGTKLFLFDFELKLLYGIYEATSAGNLNLEPAAFRGKFPAQVQFRIFKECLPLPESSLRHVIKENYTGSKFKQELSNMQVEKLISFFRPLGASSCQSAPRALANVSLPRAMPPPAIESQYLHRGRLPMMEVPYIAEMQYNHTQPLAESQTVLMANYLQPGYHRAAAYVEQVHPTLGHPSLPATRNYYVASSQPSFTEGVAHGMPDPYSRYRAIEGTDPHAQLTSLQRYITVEQRAPHQFPLQREPYQDNTTAYYSNPSATAYYTSSVMQTQVPAPHRPLPLHIAQYQDSIVAHSVSNAIAQAMEQRAPPDVNTISERLYDHQLPLQREAVYQDNVAAYNSNPSSAMAHCSSSVMHTQVPSYQHHTGAQYQDGIIACSANPAAQAVELRAPHNEQSNLERQYHHQLPLQREAVYHDNVAAYNSNPSSAMAHCSSSAMHTQVPSYQHQTVAQYQDGTIAYSSYPVAQAMEHRNPHNGQSILETQYYHQLPLQREAVYQGNVAAYSSNTSSAMANCSSSVLQTQVPSYQHQTGAQYQNGTIAYSSYPLAQAMEHGAPHNGQSSLERQYHHQLPLQRDAVYQGTSATYNSNPSSATGHHVSPAMHSQVPAPPQQQLPLQRGAYYQDSNVAYSTPNPAPGTLTQPQLQLLAQYASSVMQTEVVSHTPITS